MSDEVGIDDLNVFASTLALEARDLASARGAPPSQLERLEFVRRALPPAYEDPVTLAVNAARPIVEDAGAGSFELLVVATEAGIDGSTPVSAYVHKYLGLGRRCRNVQVKHACYAGTGALQLAASWARADADDGKRALVIMTDMGRRAFGHAAEPEQGAGAVALSVCKRPRVLALERGSGYASRETFDATGPARLEFASDSLPAISSYLDLLEATWRDYRALHGARSVEDHFAYLAFHTPLPRLVRHAFRWICTEGDARAQTEIDAAFRRMVEPSFCYTRELGNIYSGTLYAALASLIDTAPDLWGGDRVGFYSYGHGACAEFFSGVLQTDARDVLSRHRIADRLAQRQRVTVAEYEAVMAVTECGLTSPQFVPDLAFPLLHYANAYEGRDLLVLDRVRDYHRQYRWS